MYTLVKYKVVYFYKILIYVASYVIFKNCFLLTLITYSYISNEQIIIELGSLFVLFEKKYSKLEFESIFHWPTLSNCNVLI